jgi:glutathione synthase/RimK-type ligase-like ATP-grasp enzyme
MPPLAVLVPTFPFENRNLDHLLPALRRVLAAPPALAALDTLRMDGGSIVASAQDGTAVRLDRTSLVWVMGFGARQNFLDKLQLLHLLERDVAFVNGCDALLYRHAKYACAADVAPLQQPLTHASHDVDWLLARLRDGGRWVAKPPAASFGRGVFFLDGDADPARARLEHLTDYGRGQYCLLQQHVDTGRQERRVLMAGGTVVGSYVRSPGARGHGNLARGATAVAGTPGEDETAAYAALARRLAEASIGYAGVDTIFPFCLEVNVANPGGIATLVELGDTGAPERCARAIVARHLRR